MTMTQSVTAAFPELARLHAAAKQDSRMRFNNLITEGLLEEAYRALNRKARRYRRRELEKLRREPCPETQSALPSTA